MRVLLLSAFLLLGGLQTASAQSGLDFSVLDNLFGDEPIVEVNLRGALLGLVAEASRSDEPEFASMVDGLSGIYVRQYQLSSAGSGAINQINEMARALEADGWETLVRVRDEDENTYVYLRPDGSLLDGMVVITLDEDDNEATFVSIDGLIDPSSIADLGSRFGGVDVDID